jgi:hypothetical protein
MPLNLSPASLKCDWGCIFDRSFRTGIYTFISGTDFTLPEGSEDCRQKPSQALGLTIGQPTRLATRNPAFLMCSYTRDPHLAAKPRPLPSPDVLAAGNAVTLNSLAVTLNSLAVTLAIL